MCYTDGSLRDGHLLDIGNHLLVKLDQYYAIYCYVSTKLVYRES